MPDLSTLISPQLLMFLPALVAIDLALTAVVKGIVAEQHEKWMPLVAIAVGELLVFLIPHESIPVTILAGIVVALTASGAWSGTKSIVSPG